MRVTLDDRSNLIIPSLSKVAAASAEIVNAALESVAYEARAAVRHNLDNRFLRRRTSRLYDSYIYKKRGKLNFMVYPGGGRSKSGRRKSLNYAAILERGGTIRPRAGRALRFEVAGRWVTRRSVTIRGRHFIDDVRRNYVAGAPARQRYEASLRNEFSKRGLSV